MELRPYTVADIGLTEALETDPEVMRDLGGPLAAADVGEVHQRRLADCGPDGDWWLVIEPDPGGPPAGTIGIWEATHRGEAIHETGWTVLPAFQGRGIAGGALEILLERARGEPRFRQLHAFPAIRNAASNALCRRFGFTLLGELDHVYRGRPLRTNDWRLDLTERSSGAR